MAKFIYCQVEDTDASLEVPLILYRNALAARPVGHVDRPSTLIHLAAVHSVRFEKQRDEVEGARAEALLHEAMELSSTDTHENRAATSALKLHARRRVDPVQAYGQSSVKRESDPRLTENDPMILSNQLLEYFERFGDLADLQHAITVSEELVRSSTPIWDGQYHAGLTNLANALTYRFKHLGELSDLEEAISRHRDAVDSTPRGHRDMPSHLNNLGLAFGARFKRLGELRDLEHAISILRGAVDLTPLGHLHKPTLLDSLGSSLSARFDRLGELRDLEEAILKHRDAVGLTPHGHPGKPSYLNNLANAFKARFRHLGELSDLKDSITTLRDAVDLIPHGHPDRPLRLNSLGNSFFTRFQRLKEPSDLEQAISTLRDAVDLTPHGHPNKVLPLNNLGNVLKARFQRLGELSDLQDAISRYRDAVDLTPHGHPHKPAILNNLGNSFNLRFRRQGQLSDLEDAISTLRDAVDLTPQSHPDKLSRLFNFGHSFLIRFERLGERTDIEQAISIYSHAASASIGPISVRFLASRNWIFCARRVRHHTLLHAYSVAINLLPQLAWIGISLTHRYDQLRRGANVVREAAAAALDSGLPETAVEWLEQGRSVVWGELFQLRSAYDELSSARPDHARRLRELSTALEHASATREQSLSALSEQDESAAHSATNSLQREADRHRMLAIERDKLLHEIRGFPGFERFLLHKEFSQLRASAHSGPVVILNAAETRCDALIVLSDVDHAIHVPLPNFNFKRSTNLQNVLERLLGHARDIYPDERKGDPATRAGISWESVLSSLWKGVAGPVLDALAFSVCHAVLLEFIIDPTTCLRTDSWQSIAHFLVSDWPFCVSSYPWSWFL